MSRLTHRLLAVVAVVLALVLVAWLGEVAVDSCATPEPTTRLDVAVPAFAPRARGPPAGGSWQHASAD